ncbi:MAG: hypothetical protein ACO1RT_07400 [Planctomycetaceae bacterium]
MAACNLTIELDDPTRARVGGEPISGTVIVRTDNDVQCKGLNVNSYWATHGRGNVAQGEVETKSLFQGAWQAGQVYRYPFSLATASWPPTYYGHHFNVSHFVQASADIPWSIDPRATEEFRVVAVETPADLTPVDNKTKSSSWIGWLVGFIVLGVLFAAVIPLAVIVTPLVVVGVAVYWFFFRFLPRQITGEVQLTIEPAALLPGQTLRGSCEFTPKWNSATNGITWKVRCAEVCVSGSGSNRTTHTHEVLSKTQRLMEPGQLKAGESHKFEFSFVVPATAPPSMTFKDNNISWTSELRIDIPRWPDWSKSEPFVVKVAPAGLLEPKLVSEPSTVPAEDDDTWLTEVLQQITQSKDEPERLEVVLEAVKEQTFVVTVDIQGEVDEPYDAEIDDEGTWLAAIDTRRQARFALFVPTSIDARSMQWVSGWRGSVAIVGFDSETQKVMLRLLEADLPAQFSSPERSS